MAIDEIELFTDIKDRLRYEDAISTSTAIMIAKSFVENLKTENPQWFQQPKIPLTTFLTARAHDHGIAGTRFGKAIEAQVKRYVDWAQGYPGDGQPPKLGAGLKEALKTLAESWKNHPDYERIDWP